MQLHRDEKLGRIGIGCTIDSASSESTNGVIHPKANCPRCGTCIMAMDLANHLQECIKAQNRGQSLQTILTEEKRKAHGTKDPKDSLMQEERKRKRESNQFERTNKRFRILAPSDVL